MAKRFTDSNKWDDLWFQELPLKYKLFWQYLLDKCDHAGIWKVNFKMASFVIGEKITEIEAMQYLGKNVHKLELDRWFLFKFIEFQYGQLNENNRVHLSAINILKKYNLLDGNNAVIKLTPYMDLISPLQGVKDKDKDKDKDKAKFKDKEKEKHLLWCIESFKSTPNVVKPKAITKDRKDKLQRLIEKQKIDIDLWNECLDLIATSDFIRGSSFMNLEWISKEVNFIKVLEGSYNTRNIKKEPTIQISKWEKERNDTEKRINI